jgi:hypothetical protein
MFIYYINFFQGNLIELLQEVVELNELLNRTSSITVHESIKVYLEVLIITVLT